MAGVVEEKPTFLKRLTGFFSKKETPAAEVVARAIPAAKSNSAAKAVAAPAPELEPIKFSLRAVGELILPKLFGALDEKSKLSAARSTEDVAPLPVASTRVLEELARRDTSTDRVANLVRLDPALAVSVLRYANSAGLGGDKEITNVERALVRIGHDLLQTIVLKSGVASLKAKQRGTDGYNAEELWKHSVATSVYAAALARLVPGVDPGEAATAGLLHDIGKMLVNVSYPDRAKELMNPASFRAGESYLAREERILGASHTVYGGILARHWKLPETLALAIELHHHPALDALESCPPNVRTLAGVTFLANQLAKLNSFAADDKEIDLASEDLMRGLGLPSDIMALRTLIPSSAAVRIDALLKL